MSTDEAAASDLPGRLASWAASRPAGVVMAVLALAIVALLYARSLELDALPDVTPNQVVVLTRAPGLAPEEVERLVTRPVELACSGMSGVDHQRSLSRYGIGAVTIIFDDSIDPWLARQQVAERVATIEGLPDGVSAPELAPFTGGLGEVYHLVLESPSRTPTELLEIAEWNVAPILRAEPGVVEVNVWGGERRTLDVRVEPRTLARHGLTLGDVASATASASASVPGATLPAGPGQVMLRGRHWPTTPAELASVAVPPSDPHGDGGMAMGDEPPLRLGQLGLVEQGARTRIGAATANGNGEVVYLMVQMLRDANALELTGRLEARLADVKAAVPEDVTVRVAYDRRVLVMATLETVGENLLEGALLVLIVLLAMLGSIRAGLLVASIIPLAMLGAVAGMVWFEIPGNLMSLGAIDFGLLVDGAVVMVERVFYEMEHRREELDDPVHRRAALSAAMRDVARPVFFSVMIIALVYVPIVALTGVDGKMFRPMALTVVFAVLTALALALTFVPAAILLLLRPRDVPQREPWLPRTLARAYAPVLAGVAARPAAVAVGAVALLALGGGLFARAGVAFVPQLDEGSLVLQTSRPADVSLESAIDEGLRLERTVMDAAPEVRAITSRIGSPAVATDLMGLEQADIFVDLAPREEWRPGLTKPELLEEIDAAIQASRPGAEVSMTQPIQMRFNEMIEGSPTDVTVSVFGEDLGQMRAAAEDIVAIIDEVPGVADAKIQSPPDLTILEVRPRLLEAQQLGFSAREVLDLVTAIRSGLEVGVAYDGPVQVSLRVLASTRTPSAFELASLPVATPSGEVVPLERIADVRTVPSPSLVSHDMAQRRIVVGFNVRGRSLGDAVQEAQARLRDELELARGLRLQWGGQYETLQIAQARLAVVLPVVMVLIIALLVWNFGALRPALLIFLNVPFAGVGGMVALTLRGLPVSISAAVGFIALSGIAVLNGVVLLTSTIQLEAEGRPAREAALVAAQQRLRPVMMTALVAALGFVPMMLATGPGAEVQRPLATVVVGGLVTSTILTLLILPALYPWLSPRRATGDEG